MGIASYLKSNLLTISVIINVVLIAFILINRNVKEVTAPIQPKHLLKDDNYFSEYFKVDNRVLFVGNSLVFKCDWKKLLDNPNVINRGVGGITTYEIFMRFNKIIDGKPKKIFFLMGINDIEQGAPEDIIMENFHRILYELKAKSPLTKVYFISLFPVAPELRDEDNQMVATNEIVDHLNTTIKNFTDTFGLNYIDVNSLLKNENRGIDSSLSIDGIHVKQLAYEKMKGILKEKVEE